MNWGSHNFPVFHNVPVHLAELSEILTYINLSYNKDGFLGDSDSKESAYNAKRLRFDPWVGKIPWRREWLPTPVFLPGEFHGQRSLAGHSPWGLKESDSTE